MKILLLGKDGQVGRELQRALSPLGDLVALGRNSANLLNPDELLSTLRAHAPEVIVNAAAYTAVDKAESDAINAMRVNAEAVGELAHYAAANGALLIHYSTDYVFDGSKAAAYVESDAANPQNIYGKSKRAGEEAILSSGCKALILRTSWVFSVHGGNFVKSMLKLSRERESLNVVADQFGTPTSAALIAEVTARAIRACASGSLASGIYHLTASGSTSWHGLAVKVISRAADKGAALKVDAAQIHPIPTDAYPLPAARPKNSRLSNAALASGLNFNFPSWEDGVENVVDQLIEMEKSA